MDYKGSSFPQGYRGGVGGDRSYNYGRQGAGGGGGGGGGSGGGLLRRREEGPEPEMGPSGRLIFHYGSEGNVESQGTGGKVGRKPYGFDDGGENQGRFGARKSDYNYHSNLQGFGGQRSFAAHGGLERDSSGSHRGGDNYGRKRPVGDDGDADRSRSTEGRYGFERRGSRGREGDGRRSGYGGGGMRNERPHEDEPPAEATELLRDVVDLLSNRHRGQGPSGPGVREGGRGSREPPKDNTKEQLLREMMDMLQRDKSRGRDYDRDMGSSSRGSGRYGPSRSPPPGASWGRHDGPPPPRGATYGRYPPSEGRRSGFPGENVRRMGGRHWNEDSSPPNKRMRPEQNFEQFPARSPKEQWLHFQYKYNCAPCKFSTFNKEWIEEHVQGTVHRNTLKMVDKMYRKDPHLSSFLHHQVLKRNQELVPKMQKEWEETHKKPFSTQIHGFKVPEGWTRLVVIRCLACRTFISLSKEHVLLHLQSYNHTQKYESFQEEKKKAIRRLVYEAYEDKDVSLEFQEFTKNQTAESGSAESKEEQTEEEMETATDKEESLQTGEKDTTTVECEQENEGEGFGDEDEGEGDIEGEDGDNVKHEESEGDQEGEKEEKSEDEGENQAEEEDLLEHVDSASENVSKSESFKMAGSKVSTLAVRRAGRGRGRAVTRGRRAKKVKTVSSSESVTTRSRRSEKLTDESATPE